MTNLIRAITAFKQILIVEFVNGSSRGAETWNVPLHCIAMQWVDEFWETNYQYASITKTQQIFSQEVLAGNYRNFSIA